MYEIILPDCTRHKPCLCLGQAHWDCPAGWGSSPASVHAPGPPPPLPSVMFDPPAPPPPADFDRLVRWWTTTVDGLHNSASFTLLCVACVSALITKKIARTTFASDPRSRQICKFNSPRCSHAWLFSRAILAVCKFASSRNPKHETKNQNIMKKMFKRNIQSLKNELPQTKFEGDSRETKEQLEKKKKMKGGGGVWKRKYTKKM